MLKSLGVAEVPAEAAHSKASLAASTPALQPDLPSLSMHSVYQACLTSPGRPAAKLCMRGVHMLRLEARQQLVHGQPERQVYGLTFSSQTERPVQYRPGDVAMLWPTNEFAQGGRTQASEGTALALVPRLLSRMHTEPECVLLVAVPAPDEPVHVRALPAAARPCAVSASNLVRDTHARAGRAWRRHLHRLHAARLLHHTHPSAPVS